MAGWRREPMAARRGRRGEELQREVGVAWGRPGDTSAARNCSEARRLGCGGAGGASGRGWGRSGCLHDPVSKRPN